MPQVLIRDVDAKVLASLKRRAKANSRSLEAELRLILREAAGQSGTLTMPEFLRATEPLRRKLAVRKHTDSAALLRAGRRERDEVLGFEVKKGGRIVLWKASPMEASLKEWRSKEDEEAYRDL